MNGRTHFVSESTAPSWDAGILCGSGRVGVIIWGGPDQHHLSLAHERFFLPANSHVPPPSFAEAMPEVRAALLRHEAEHAAAIVAATAADAGFSEMIWTDPLAPASQLTLTFERSGPAETTTSYRRCRDLETGEITITWEAGGSAREVRVTSPRGGRRVRLRVRSEGSPRVRLRLAITEDAGADLPGAASYAGLVDAAARLVGPTAAELTVVADKGEHRRTALTTIVQGSAGDVQIVDEGATAADFSAVLGDGSWIEFDIALQLSADDPEMLDLGQMPALQSASRLDLRAGISQDLPTEHLIDVAGTDPGAMRGLIELAYAAGRANIIAATGELPATLQGVWQSTWSPAWSADYTLNGNLQNGGMASLTPTGTPELSSSLSRLLVPHLGDFRLNASRIFGFEGAMVPSRMTTHGLANHFSRDYPHQFWISSGGWMLRMLADAVLASGDRGLVDDATWRLVEEILLFLREVIAHGPVAPSYSPENTPRGATTPLAVDATMDLAILRDAQRSGNVLAEAHGSEPIALPEVTTSYRIDDEGRLAEWADPDFSPQLAHRHASALYPLWYDVDPAFEAPALRDAAIRLVRDKIAWRAEDPGPPPGHGEMAFGLAQLGLAAAALGDAESAEQCLHWLATQHFTSAMATTHDAGAIFNLDASGSLPALVAAMLVDSSRDSISILPALPVSWAAGAVSGLTTRTALTIEFMEWSATGVTLALTGTRESAWVRRGPVRLRLPRPGTLAHSPEPVTGIMLDHRATRHEIDVRWAASLS